MRLRFAPSPTGQLHVGNARTALFNWMMARGSGGSFVLRIENTDVERSTRDSEEGILTDLRWLGLDWDEGPDVGGAHGPYRQSERLGLYASYANELVARGYAYHCFCTAQKLEGERQAALAAGLVPRYAGTCRGIPVRVARARIHAGERAVVRFRVPDEGEVVFDDVVRGQVRFGADVIGDLIILRPDGRPAYNFAVVVDDALMEITDVVRGEDHISNTPRQILMYEALGFPLPRFAHLAMVLGPDHSPLSKRHGATSVAEFRTHGYLPEALVNYLALIGWSPGHGDELLPTEQLVQRFSLEAVGHSAGVFDLEKLSWANRHYLKLADPARIARLSITHFRSCGFVNEPREAGTRFLMEIMAMATGSVDRLEQIPQRLRFLFVFDPARAGRDEEVRRVLDEPGAREVAVALAEELAGSPRLDRELFRQVAARVRQRTGQKARALFHPIRVVLTGEAGGPELDLAVPAIDRGAELPADCGVASIIGCRERAKLFAEHLTRNN